MSYSGFGRRILMISSEVESLARTGGLGDAVEALSRALVALGLDVLIVTPRYGVTRVPTDARWWSTSVQAPLGPGRTRSLGVLEARLGARGPRVCMVADDPLFGRDGIYGDRFGAFGDNDLRFATLSSAALSVAERAWGGELPDVVHAHDWHATLALLYARRTRGASWARVPTVLTIHNLAYQGAFGAGELEELGIPREVWEEGLFRHDEKINLMQGGIQLADRVTTVSPTYAREIQQPQHGHGLDAVVRANAGKLVGIVNGIDTESFDPRTDGAIVQRYGEADALAGKRECRRALCAELGLDDGPAAGPLFASVSRLDWLKGVDLFLAVLPALVDRGARAVLVGTGDAHLEEALHAAGQRWPSRVATRVAFDPLLARRVFAGADFVMVPSRQEPCGLTQMYGMRYGAVPIVSPVGGLCDTVEPLDAAHATGTGLVAAAVDPSYLLIACEDALGVSRDPVAWSALVARAMLRDSSWTASARRYATLYEEAS
jgi:starch synthase